MYLKFLMPPFFRSIKKKKKKKNYGFLVPQTTYLRYPIQFHIRLQVHIQVQIQIHIQMPIQIFPACSRRGRVPDPRAWRLCGYLRQHSWVLHVRLCRGTAARQRRADLPR